MLSPMPGIFSSSWRILSTSSSFVRALFHSLFGFSTTIGSLRFGPMGSVASSAAPIFETTAVTSGT